MGIYYIAGLPYSDELYHYGIKGQRWGIRRYQNSDGTLTSDGKKRYNKKVETAEKRERKENRKKIIKDAANVHKMSDAELLAKIGRLQNEKRLMELSYDRLTSSADPAKQSLINAGKKAVQIALPGIMLYGAYGLTTGNWNPTELAKYAFPNPNLKKK